MLINILRIPLPVALTVTTKSASPELSVVGEGKVDVVPDTAYVSLGIQVNDAQSVDEVQKKINTVNNAIVDSLKKLGIAKEDIKTSNYSTSDEFRLDNTNAKPTTYTGNATVEVKVENKDMVSQVIQAGTQAGANQVLNTRFVVDKPEKYREEARTKAINNAKEQAQKLASQLGIKLGKVTNIVESTDTGVQPMPMFAKAADARVGSAPAPELEAGNSTITSTVTLYFEKN
jgi:uncharacterized protein YggE